MAESLCHAGVGFALPDLHIDVQGWDFQRTDTAILAFHTVNACIGGRLVAG